MKAIYRLNFDAGKMGNLPGIFITEKEKVSVLIESGAEVYFGEVLGKHSEIYGPIEDVDITMVTDDPEAIEVFERFNFKSGFNPFNHRTINFHHDQFDTEGGEMDVDDLCEKLIALKTGANFPENQ